ncbi:Leukocyte immunoglobulin-like receptor subfamily B member 3, partial [Microtus ochrogaster]
TEKLHKPTIWAEPDSVVTKGLSVDIFCFGTQEVQKYYLYKKERLKPSKIQTSLEPGNKVNFSIPFITEYHAGLYYCCYFSPSNLSECSDTLELVVTGFYSKPNISALPSSLVTSGGNDTLQCSSHQGYEKYILTKEGEQNVSWTQDSQKQPNGHFMALFLVGPVTSKHRWALRCYDYYERTSQMWSMPSETLQLLLVGSLPNPVLRAEPGSVVANGSQVTVICEGTPGARDYYLYQIGNQGSLQRLTPIKPGNIAKFLIPIIQWSHAGRYLCFYHKPPRWSKKSNTLELVVTGKGYLLPKPMLSSLTSLVVTSGEIMTFQCASWERYNGFVLTKEDEKFSRLQDSQYINSTEQFQALFHTGPVTVSHTGIFRCYGYKNSTYMWSNPSDSLEIHIAGEVAAATGQLHDTPTLSVLPGSRMSSGEDVTLVCQSSHRRDSFVLSKEGTAHSLLYLRSVLQNKLYQAKFFMRNVTFTHGGTYKCYSSEDLYPYLLSYPSNAVELVVSGSSEDPDSLSKEPIPTFGIFENKPCLSVLPRCVVTPGKNVTFKCFSQEEYDSFIVIKEGEQKHSMIMESQKTSAGQFQALFFVGPMTSSSSGTFKCYGYYKANPQVWSEPSDHLEIQVLGSAMNTKLSKDECKPKTASNTQDHTVENLIRMGLAGLVFIILGTLLFEHWRNQSWTYHEAGK